ncbi:MAG: hypothetical protein AAFQ50_16605, partial [Pseudomonadota bacterium]
MDCRFVTAIEAMQTKFTALYLNGSSLPGLNAEGAEVKGHIFLRVATVNGEVSLSGAVIGGQLDFDGATLSNKGSYALNAQGAEVKGGVFLRRATTKGEVCLSGAIIGGQLEFNGATLSNEGGYALNAQGAVVKGGLIWREGASCPEGVMDFAVWFRASHAAGFRVIWDQTPRAALARGLLAGADADLPRKVFLSRRKTRALKNEA